MISTVFLIGLRRLVHNRVELMMTFVVPIAFFSIFAVIFGRGMGTTPKVKTVIVDEIDDETSHAVVREIASSDGLRIMRRGDQSMSRDDAEALVRGGSVTIAIVLRKVDDRIAAELLADTADQVAPQVVSALVTRSLLVRTDPGTGDVFSQFAINLRQTEMPDEDAGPSETPATRITERVDSRPDDAVFTSPDIEVVDVMKVGKANPVVSMYAAGIAVMFLLFGASNGGGALLEEKENQTLERLLTTRLSMDQLLLGKWFYQTALGVSQVLVMFVWAQLVFGVDLLGHFDGFVVMTVVTSAAAAAFGLFLATLCKSRGQLNGLSVIVILTMSALGGSMVPRYVMSEGMRDAGLWTFNAWALDGYDKVFWRDLPVSSLGPQLAVLLSCAFAFMLVARVLAIRWETQ